MFILGLRDAYGLKLTIGLFLIWNVYFFAALYTDIIWLAVVLLAASVAITCYISFLLCKRRDELIFSSRFAREHGFPSSPQSSRATFNMHLTAFMLFFAAPSIATFFPVLAEDMGTLYGGYLFGIPGVVGVLHHFVRGVVDRMALQTNAK